MSINILTHDDTSAYAISRHMSGELTEQSPADARSTLRAAIRSQGTARTVAIRSHGAICGLFPSHKMRRAFAVESRHEHRALLLADTSEHVVRFSVQAVQVRYWRHGKICAAYPDVMVETIDGRLEMWECKASPALGTEVRERLLLLHRMLSDIGIHYRTRYPEWLSREPRAANAQTIWRHADRIISTDVQEAMLHTIRSGAQTLGQIGAQLDCKMTSLIAMVGQGKLAADIHTALLGPDTRVREPLSGATSGGF